MRQTLEELLAGPHTQEGPRDGSTFDHSRDLHRLNRQASIVWEAMSDGDWHTPMGLELWTGFNWASISARLRDFRKPQFGGHTVERRNMGGGLFHYRLIPSSAHVELSAE